MENVYQEKMFVVEYYNRTSQSMEDITLNEFTLPKFIKFLQVTQQELFDVRYIPFI